MKKLILMVCLGASLCADSFDTRAKLTVRGEATLYKAADQLRISIGVISQAETAEAALNDNNLKMAQVIKALEGKGLTKEDYHTGRFTIQPVWTQPPKGAVEDWSPSIASYKVTNSLSIKTDQIEKAGDFIDAASGAGANSIDDISFGMKDARSFRAEAITAASTHAMADARILAASSQQKLVRVLDISLDGAQPAPIVVHTSPMAFAKMAGNGSFSSINPGDVEISAAVLMVYEIAP